MKYCKNCGTQLDQNAVVCPNCGAVQENIVVDSGSFGWACLGACFPIVGLILFLVWKDTKPASAKKAGIGALVAVIAYVVFYVLIFALGFGSIALSGGFY